MSETYIEIELTGDFEPVDAEAARIDGYSEQIGTALGSGLAGERTLKLIADAAKPVIEKLKTMISNMIQPNRVNGIKVTKDGVEIGSVRSDDLDEVKTLAFEILDRLNDD